MARQKCGSHHLGCKQEIGGGDIVSYIARVHYLNTNINKYIYTQKFVLEHLVACVRQTTEAVLSLRPRMTCKHVVSLVTPQGVKRVSLAAENVFAAANRPCPGTATSLVPRCVEPSCPHPASGDIHVCVECVYSACHADITVFPISPSSADEETPVGTGPPSQTTLSGLERELDDREPSHKRVIKKGSAMSHLTKHDVERSHPVSLSVDHGRLFCCRCNDFVYNPYLDAAVALQRNIAYSHRRNFLSSSSPLDPRLQLSFEHALVQDRAKRRRILSMNHWVPTKRELELIRTNSLINENKSATTTPPVGLYNLGNSCYMNSVLQAFLNAPPLRCFFLADGHRPHCARTPKLDCLGCAMDTLVCDSHVGEIASLSNRFSVSGRESSSPSHPFLVPQRILEIVWRHADNLASYAQHDAHEFLITTLNVLSAHCRHSPMQKSSYRSAPSGSKGTTSGRATSGGDIQRRSSAGTNRTSTRASDRQKPGRLTPTGGNRVMPVDPVSPVRNLRRSVSGGFASLNSAGTAAEPTIVHTLFSGTLQSDVICRVCGNSSSTLEKFYDISLDVDNVLKPHLSARRSRGESPDVHGLFSGNIPEVVGGRGSCADMNSQGADVGMDGIPGSRYVPGSDPCSVNTDGSEADGTLASSSPHILGENESSGDMETANTLGECLSRFTEPEMLGESSKMHCNVCGIKQEAMKQMSVRGLPPILCFHFKRFEQSFAKVRRSEMVKIDTAVEFPVDNLNMKPFQTSSVIRKRSEKDGTVAIASVDKAVMRGLQSWGCRGSMDMLDTGGHFRSGIARPGDECIYDLFAVVNHTGKIDRGHYTTLVRRRGSWFKCDDEKVTAVSNVGNVIRSGEAYLVYYVQRKPNFLY